MLMHQQEQIVLLSKPEMELQFNLSDWIGGPYHALWFHRLLNF